MGIQAPHTDSMKPYDLTHGHETWKYILCLKGVNFNADPAILRR